MVVQIALQTGRQMPVVQTFFELTGMTISAGVDTFLVAAAGRRCACSGHRAFRTGRCLLNTPVALIINIDTDLVVVAAARTDTRRRILGAFSVDPVNAPATGTVAFGHPGRHAFIVTVFFTIFAVGFAII